jgi:hypothetical protein
LFGGALTETEGSFSDKGAAFDEDVLYQTYIAHCEKKSPYKKRNNDWIKRNLPDADQVTQRYCAKVKGFSSTMIWLVPRLIIRGTNLLLGYAYQIHKNGGKSSHHPKIIRKVYQQFKKHS